MHEPAFLSSRRCGLQIVGGQIRRLKETAIISCRRLYYRRRRRRDLPVVVADQHDNDFGPLLKVGF